MPTTFVTPPFLNCSEGFEDQSAYTGLKIWPVVAEFMAEFGLDWEVAMASCLAAASHAMGGCVRTSTTFGSFEAPFSLLLVTPETDPIWTHVPVRLLTSEFEAHCRHALEVYQTQKRLEGKGLDQDAADTEHKTMAELGEQMFVNGTVERVTSSNLRFPFPKSLIDNHVLLTTPGPGVRRGLKSLSKDKRYELELSLSSGHRLVASDGVRSSGVPSFYWQVPKGEAAKLFQDNLWLCSAPFLMLEAAQPGTPLVNIRQQSVSMLQRLCQHLLDHRYLAMGRGRKFSTDGKNARSLEVFLAAAQRWQQRVGPERVIPVRRVAEVGLKFAMVFAAMEGHSELKAEQVRVGLALAKRLTARHYRTLAKYVGAEQQAKAPDLTELPERHREVYRRIQKAPKMTPSQLSRSFNRMRKQERDGILDELEGRGLIGPGRGTLIAN